MRLIKVLSGKNAIVAPVLDGCTDEYPTSEVQEFLLGAAPDMQASAKGVYALLKRYAMDGRSKLTSGNFHEANKQEAIWEFVKGRLRIFCYVDSNESLVLLSHGAVKKTQKADKGEVARAVRLKQAYLAAKKAGTVEIVEIAKNEIEEQRTGQ